MRRVLPFLLLLLLAMIARAQSTLRNAGSPYFDQANEASVSNPMADAATLVEKGWAAVKAAGPQDPGFLDGIFTAAGLFHGLGLERRVESIYEEAILACDKPALREKSIGLKYMLAQDYIRQQEYVKAENALRAGLAADADSGNMSPLYVAFMQSLAFVREQEGELEDAERLYLKTLDCGPPNLTGVVLNHLTTSPGPPLPAIGNPQEVLAAFYVYHSRPAEAEPLFRDQVARAGRDREKRLAALRQLSWFLAYHGSKLEAVTVQQEILSLVKSEHSQSPGFQNELSAEQSTLAMHEVDAGLGEEAKRMLQANLRQAQESKGVQSLEYRRALHNLFENRCSAGDYEMAEQLARQELRLAQESGPSQETALSSALSQLASVLRVQGRAAEGDALQRQANEAGQQFTRLRQRQLQARFAEAETMIRQDRPAEALAEIEATATAYFPFRQDEFFSFHMIAQSFLTFHYEREASSVADRALSIVDRQGAGDPRYVFILIDWANFYRGQLRRAAVASELLDRAEKIIQTCCGDQSSRMESLLREQAWAALGGASEDGGLAELKKLRNFQSAVHGANSRAVEYTTREIAQSYARSGKWIPAARTYKEALTISFQRTGGRGAQYVEIVDSVAMEFFRNDDIPTALALNQLALDGALGFVQAEDTKARVQQHRREILDRMAAGQQIRH